MTVLKQHRLKSIALITVFGLVMTACGSSQDAGPKGATTTGVATGEASSGSGDTTSGSSETTPGSSPAAGGSGETASGSGGGAVTLVTHNSFNVDKQVLADFEAKSGITLTVLAQDALPNQLVLTKDNPLGDVAYGIDNTFASRAVDAGVFAPYTSPLLDQGSNNFAFDDSGALTAVDFGDVCVNVDHKWFAEKGLAEPATFADLIKPEYKDLLVAQSPATSSTGLAFLLGTIANSGVDGWQAYWEALRNNGIKIEADWESSYYVDFSGSDGKGDRPLVVSYGSSPPAEVKDGATEAPTGVLTDTCFRQVEYAGVLAGAKNPVGAQQVVDFLLSPEFQAGLPDAMYVYPVDTKTQLPPAWSKYAQAPTDTKTLEPGLIATERDTWIQDWSDLIEG